MKHRILIVDDSEEIHELYKKTVEKMNSKEVGMSFVLDHCFQGEVAVLKVREAHKEKCPYSLVIMDIRMPPGMDGIETIKHIRKEFPETEFIVCTAFRQYNWEDLLDIFGPTDRILYMNKPYNNTTMKQMTFYVASKYEREVKDAA
ncbi:hypothetical protein A9Q84_10165 [Halobacteriovorax marinus]|uniref:Response regulatory domain-containing protein n=1 Tax=Halobacteriovorax marinus TaxID=97084 RepID=A0A1Y5F721_9BACT|nr:hypothetical protein A9Q84_10165 [Halobacteriovorax marinus]